MTLPEAYAVPTIERIRVRYGETDQMGHAYYANYLFWFEQARGGWCRDRGFAYKQMEEMGYKLPVVEAHLNYKSEVLYDEWIQVRIWVSEIRRASLKFEYEIVNETTGKIATTGYTWHVLIGPERKATSIPQVIREWMDRDPRSTETLA